MNLSDENTVKNLLKKLLIKQKNSPFVDGAKKKK